MSNLKWEMENTFPSRFRDLPTVRDTPPDSRFPLRLDDRANLMISHRIESARFGYRSRSHQFPFHIFARKPAFIFYSRERRGLGGDVDGHTFGHPTRRAPATQYLDHRVGHLVAQCRVQNSAPPEKVERLQFDPPPASRARGPAPLARGRDEIGGRRVDHNLERARLREP